MSVLTEKIRLSGTFRLFLSPIAGDKALTLPQPISGGLSSRFGSPAPTPRGGRKTMAYMWNNTKIIPSLPVFLLFLFFSSSFSYQSLIQVIFSSSDNKIAPDRQARRKAVLPRRRQSFSRPGIPFPPLCGIPGG